MALFTVSLKIATQDAKKFMPSFDTLPKNVKMVLVDLSFNLGYSRLSKFVKTKQFIEQGNFKEAAQELHRCGFLSLPVDEIVGAHIDEGTYYLTRNRYHLSIVGRYQYFCGT